MRRVRCIFHAERTPSLVIRSTHFFCYGCGRRGPVGDLPSDLVALAKEDTEEEPEDISSQLEYIGSLRRLKHRGLEFPTDSRGYFIVWPDKSYYKYRLFEGKPKYIGPRGYKPPSFWARKEGQTLALVEGEINALSMSKAFPEYAVMSPGSTTNFNPQVLANNLTHLKSYANIVVILDNDEAGIKALIRTKAYFLYKFPFVDYLLLDQDANDLFVESGTEGLRARVQKGLQNRL